MFTGIVQTIGRVAAVATQPSGVRLSIDTGHWQPDEGRAPIPGDSICVSGACLTVADLDGRTLGFDVVPETLNRTVLGRLRPGDTVNLEPAVTASQPLGGHFMQGHVDGVGVVTAVVDQDGQWRLGIRPPADLAPFMIPKGSVSIDGVSLTLASVADDRFEVALIPTTLQRTTLGTLKPGDLVNLEADMLAKTTVTTIRRMLGASSTHAAEPITMGLLRAAGFVPVGAMKVDGGVSPDDTR